MDHAIGRDTEVIFSTPRLVLEAQDVRHAQEMFEILSDDGLYQFTGGNQHYTLVQLEKRFQSLSTRRSPDQKQHWLNWVIRLKNRNLVGYIQATVENQHALIAWTVGTKWQGLGIATEAAKEVIDWLQKKGILVIKASIHPDNTASQGVARKLGFRKTEQRIKGEIVWQRGLHSTR